VLGIVDALIAAFVLFVIVPVMAYLVAKAVTFGYYSGKNMWFGPHSKEEELNENGKE
jgi:multisubunit Na+/H+ antiporter MnhG subunit